MSIENGWTDERIQLIKRTIVPKGIPTDEFLLFIEQCKRSGLDPLLKQAYCVPRETKGEVLVDDNGKTIMEQGNNGKWYPKREKITRYEFQPSRDGMLVRANRFPDFRGLQASEVYQEDDILITYAEDGRLSNVRHSFNPAKRKGALMGAWARVAREGMLSIVVWVDFSAYAQTSPLWSSKPAVMICKVAEATALRKAYPEAFGGLYIAGERQDDGAQEEELPEAPASAHPIPRIQSLPEQTATRLETPTLDVPLTPEAVPVPVQAAPTEASTATMELAAESIINEANTVAAAAIEAGRTPEALKRARADMASLGAKAKKLPKGSAGRERVSKHFADINAQLFKEEAK